ncbi:hypothetical protein L916_06158 [Phytophthora nicotianae]|uniref:Uncharacterized protein n=1 Tax=Phytophthora nicotianae TaxID=4792 RepID=W2JA24_PHYNI|nr:hypothetical protein L916_06158 [Phytophthora nicotianae]
MQTKMSINPLLIVHFVIRPNCIILAISPWTGFLQPLMK